MREALQAQLRRQATNFAAPQGRQIAQTLAALDQESEMTEAFRYLVILSIRENGRGLKIATRKRGEFGTLEKIEVLLDRIHVLLFYHLLVGHEPHDIACGVQLSIEAGKLLGVQGRLRQQ